MKGYLLVLVLLGITLSVSAIKRPHKIDVQDNVDNLKQLANRIVTQKALNAQSIGYTPLWNYMYSGLNAQVSSADYYAVGINNVTGLGLSGITWNLTRENGNDELIVGATATVWGVPNTRVRTIFWWDASGNLAFYLEFGVQFSQVPHKFLPNNTATNPNITNWYGGVKFSGINTIGISSSTFTDNMGVTYKRGLTITCNNVYATGLPIQKDLHKLIYGPNDQNSPVTGTFIAYFPLSTEDALAYFIYQINGDIYFDKSGSVKSTSLVLTLTVDTTPTVDLTTTVLVQVNATEVLTFNVVADVGVMEGINFQGTMQGPWYGALGLPWLTFQDLTLTFNINPAGVVATFTFDGHAVLTFQKIDPIYVTWDMAIEQGDPQFDINFQTSLLGFEQLFDVVIGVTPPNANQVKATGQVSMAISSYDGPSRKGLTLQGNAVIGGTGDLAASVNSLTAYSQRQLEYTFYLYIPVFSEAPQDIDFKLAELDPFPLSDNVMMNDIHFEFSVNPSATVDMQTTIAVTFDHDPTPRLFDMEATITSQQLSFNGEMEGEWNHPLGLKWLQLSDITVNLVYDTQTQKMTTFNVNANYNITVGLAITPNIVLNFQGNFHQFSATLVVFVPDMNAFFLGVVGRSPTLTREMSFNGQITISTYAHDNVVAGLTVDGNIMIMPNGQLAQAVRSIDPKLALDFQFQLGIPVWDDGTPIVNFQYSESGGIPLVPSITLSGFTLVFDISPNPLISIATSGTITIIKNAADITFDLSAALSESGGFQLTGDMKGHWRNPFGLPWLNLDNVTAALSFTNYKLSNVEFAGIATFAFQTNTQQLAMTIQTAPDFVNCMLQVDGVVIAGIPAAVQKVFGQVPAYVNDISSLTNKVNVILSTYNGPNFVEGLTFQDNVQVSGNLLSQLKVFNRNSSPTMTFQMGLTVPVFVTNPNIVIQFATQNTPINSNVYLKNVNFEVQTYPPAISASADLFTTFSNNPQLEFQVDGSIGTDGGIILGGAILGTWDNMFGIKGFTLSNVDIAFGLNPSLCAVDLCVSALGLGYNLTIGTKQIAFYGYAQVPDLTKIFLDASVHGANGMALSFQDVAIQWNKLVGANSPVHLNVQDFPSDWGLTDLDLYIAPEDGTFNQIHYNAGFWMDGGIVMIGVECLVNVKVTDSDFEFSVHISKENFSAMLNNEIGKDVKLHPERYSAWSENQMLAVLSGAPVVQVTNVSMSDVSCQLMANTHYPRFEMDYNFFGHPNTFKVGLDLPDLYEDFAKFFHKYLSGLFTH